MPNTTRFIKPVPVLLFIVLSLTLTSCLPFRRIPKGPFGIRVTAEGPGTVAKVPAQAVPGGTTVALEPVPEPGAAFGYWAGPSSAEVSGNSLLMDGNKDLKAVFVRTKPLDLNPYKRTNPILGPGKPGSWDDAFVADPFVIEHEGRLWLFYEGASSDAVGRIGVAVSDDGETFERWGNGPVLDTYPMHLSYPQVLRADDGYYMHVTPGDKAMYLFRTSTDRFPGGWTLVGRTITVGVPGSWDEDQVYDGTIFRMDGRWMMAYSGRDHTGRSRLGLAYKPDPDLRRGGWRKWDGDGAPSPLFQPGSGWGTGHARMGGSVIVAGGLPFLFYQGASRADVHLYSEVNDQRLGLGYVSLPGRQGKPSWHLGLGSPDNGPSPVLTTGTGTWDGRSVHHMSVCEWRGGLMAVYDGHDGPDRWRIGALSLPAGILPPIAGESDHE